MSDPLGLPPTALRRLAELTAYSDTWYWCRRHGRAEPVSDPGNTDRFPGTACIRIGPFMSQREANRLGGLDRHNKPGDFAVDCWGSPMKPLGMEVER